MEVGIRDVGEFINCLHDYVLEVYEIEPRDFSYIPKRHKTSLVWSAAEALNQLREIKCPRFDGPVHVHAAKNNLEIICCTEVDCLAVDYLHNTIFGPFKREIILSLHAWLPAATWACCRVRFITGNSHTVNNDVVAAVPPQAQDLHITSYFEPSFLYYAYKTVYNSINYTFVYNIDLRESANGSAKSKPRKSQLLDGILNYPNYDLERRIFVTVIDRNSTRKDSKQPTSLVAAICHP